MVFSSPYFVFIFFPLVLVLCTLCRGRAFLPSLIVTSVAFYFWSAGADTLILLGIIVGNHLGALAMVRAGPGITSQAIVVLLIGADAIVLFVFKYATFFATNVDALTAARFHLHESIGDIALPAGVSFFIFQAISYVVDVRRGDIAAERSLTLYTAYQSFFPHLIAGPIVRFRDVVEDLRAPKRSTENFSLGLTRFSHGLFKKTVLADAVSPVADAVFALQAGQLDFATAWLGALAYAIQIYFDFSGYSDMAIGMAQMFGIRFHENFARPYGSRSVTDFWRRWHMSLSSWFRDYIYIPLGGSRGGRLATYRNLLLVFAVTGLWHGAAWTFVLWGLFHGLFLILERALFRAPAEDLKHPALRFFYVLPVVLFGWVLFRATSFASCTALWSAMVNFTKTAPLAVVAEHANLSVYSCAALVVGAAIFVVPSRLSLGARLTLPPVGRGAVVGQFAYTVFVLLAASLVTLTGSYRPFLYFTF